nr:hypothetical protein [Tanacetum cinerariifolium]GEY65971.1 hypothetical protein [Tanacetum cinerariifolium]
MAQQQQQQRDVPQDQLCPPNKRFDLMDANKKFNLVNPQCPNKSKILANILNNHPLRLCVAASASELTLTIDDLRWIFQLPQAIDNNHAGFFFAPTFSQMVLFFLDDLGFIGNYDHLQTLCQKDSTAVANTLQDLCKMLNHSIHRFCVTRRPNPETPIPIAAEVDITNLNEATQISVATQRSLEDLEAQQNVEKVKEHMMDEELEQLLEGIKNVDEDAFMDDVLNSQEDLGTMIELKSNKESLEAEKVADMVIIHDDEVGEESARDEFELRRREKRKGIEDTREACPVEAVRPMNVALLENQFQMLMVNMFWLTLFPFYEHKCGLVAATIISPDCQVCKTRTFALGDKPHSFFAPEGKPSRRGLNLRPLACGNNLPKEDTFAGNKKDDVHEHVERILDIVDRLTSGTINTWDLLKMAFIQRHRAWLNQILEAMSFEIKSQFMRELREDTFAGNKKDDVHEHVERILDIVSLFNIPGVTHDAVMLRVFPMTFTGAVKNWVDRLTSGTINTWDLLKMAFIQRDCPPSKTAKKLEDICNFKQEGEETLYEAWERNNYRGMAAIVSKLDNLGQDMKKLKENVMIFKLGANFAMDLISTRNAHLMKMLKVLKK